MITIDWNLFVTLVFAIWTAEICKWTYIKIITKKWIERSG